MLRFNYRDCEGGLETNCIPVKVILAATVSAGAIAGIVIGGVVFAALAGFGGKKGYDYYQSRRANMNTANSNPMYNDNGRTGANPFYDDGKNNIEMGGRG
jgi:hypothetical protein